MQHLLQHRKQLKQLGRNRCAGRLVGQTHAQVFFDGKARKDLAALRHKPQPQAGALVRRELVDLFAIHRDAAGLDGHQPHQRFEQRRFAHTVAAQNDLDLAHLGLQTHVPQDVGATVVLVDVFYFKHSVLLPVQFFAGPPQEKLAPLGGSDPCNGGAWGLSSAQINFNDTLIGLHLIQRALGQHRAVTQNSDDVADGANKAHVVLHHHQ